MKTLKENDIIIANVSDSLSNPNLKKVLDYPECSATIKDSRVLQGIDKVELRVLDIDYTTLEIRTAFHAVDTFNPSVSTGRIIFVTYQSMKNTVYHILNRFLRLR